MQTLAYISTAVAAIVYALAASPAHSATLDTCAAWETAGRGWVCIADPELWIAELPACKVWRVKDFGRSQLFLCSGQSVEGK